MKKGFLLKTLIALIATLMLLSGVWPAFAEPWKFGVMSDTQWTRKDDPTGMNPRGVAVSIIRQINPRFIQQKVKFVIQVGDLTEKGNDADIAERAAAARELHLAGIGFFPMRGNHEIYGSPANSYGINQFRTSFPQTRGSANVYGAANFSSPSAVSDDLTGMSYSFDYENARFVIIDNWATPGKRMDAAGYPYGYSIADQQAWISSRLSTRASRSHAFVFSHQALIAENHQDSLFSGYANANPDMQNAFLKSLQDYTVKYYICGHDHMAQRSIMASPDGRSRVQQIISGSNSSKFYTPRKQDDGKWYGQKGRETSLSQDLYRIGYYIYTVDGPRVTVDYYADDHGDWKSDEDYPSGAGREDTGVTPAFNFVKRETFGYSLNGKEFLIGGTNSPSYSAVRDSYGGTEARILAGSYANTATDYNGRILARTVNTGWTDNPGSFRSNILSLWGMAALGSDRTDTFALSLSYDPDYSGGVILMARDAGGRWVNAVDVNIGGTQKNFQAGAYHPGHGLGSYGYDPATRTAWAVVNFNGDFAVAAQ